MTVLRVILSIFCASVDVFSSTVKYTCGDRLLFHAIHFYILPEKVRRRVGQLFEQKRAQTQKTLMKRITGPKLLRYALKENKTERY